MQDAQTHRIEVIDYEKSPPVVCLALAVTVIKRFAEIHSNQAKLGF